MSAALRVALMTLYCAVGIAGLALICACYVVRAEWLL